MSISALTLSLYHSKATYSTRLVLIAIANFEGEYGAYPSHETIGRLAGGLNRRTVQRAIDDLIELGEITEIRRDGITNLYKISIACPDECDGTTNHKRKKGSGLQTAGGTETAGRGGVETAGGAVSRPHEPLDNQKKTFRETQLPDDWEASDYLMDMFVSKWPDIDPSYHIEQFKLYYLSKGTKHKNWDLTFQRWMNAEQAKAKTQPWRGGGANTAAGKAKKEAERQQTESYLAELKRIEAETKNSGPKLCKHDLTIARCVPCSKELS